MSICGQERRLMVMSDESGGPKLEDLVKQVDLSNPPARYFYQKEYNVVIMDVGAPQLRGQSWT